MSQIDSSLLQSILDKSSETPRVEKFQDTVETHTVEVPPLQEWRFELGSNDKLKLKLLKGTAEIFGTELSPNIDYSFQGSLKSSIATFSGCTIQYWGCQPSSEYVGEESCIGSYLNLHLSLERMRVSNPNSGPRVLVIGPKDSGKTSLCRVLVSYAEKMQRRPLFVNLNPKAPLFTIPGNLTATAVSGMLNVEDITLGETITTGPSFYHPKQSLVKCFGLENYRDNLELYKFLIEQLSESVEKRLESSSDVRSSGIVIDTPALHIGDCELIQHILDRFKIDVLVVIGNERLLVDLKRKLKYDDQKVTLLKVGKSSGCVDTDDKLQRELQQRAIKQYFYGLETAQLSPYTIMIAPKEYMFFKPKELESLNLAFLSGDASDDVTTRGINYSRLMERVKKPAADNLENAILAIANDSGLEVAKYISSVDDNEGNLEVIKTVVGRSVLGFCYVLSVDDQKGKVKLLVPSPVQHLPTKTLILTQFRYHE
ncbi:DEKNAAC103724 [Brettanomyces naardenensis]|uniref:Polynucleotide 5'-hydroxyl-kinase GRC3 n=1 Tax=Brettanomyces naardenensis TaxID=13370 RepID=A0A448YNT6_BRENA|nr:DEKNAAC103724 [Brettanomyces naardenensis]